MILLLSTCYRKAEFLHVSVLHLWIFYIVSIFPLHSPILCFFCIAEKAAFHALLILHIWYEHGHRRGARVLRVLLRVFTQQQDTAGPPLQPHLLRPLSGENVQAGGCHLHRLLPSLSLDYLHQSQLDFARGSVGQHRNLGPDFHGAKSEWEPFNGGFKRPKVATHRALTVSISFRTAVQFLWGFFFFWEKL